MAAERPYQFYDTAVSLCPHCLRRVDAKIVFQDGAVWMLKRCPEHGAQKVLISDDIPYYRACRETYLKTPEQSRCYNTPSRYGCPYDCGICPDHEQHGCILLVEITDRCNLRCPTCYAHSGPERLSHRPLTQIERMLDRAVANEGEPNVVQISGGEPTLHPEFFEVLDAALARPVGHLMVNTNGVRLARDPAFVERLSQYRDQVEIYLQFDSLESGPLLTLRGEDLTQTRQRALSALAQIGMPVNLVCTLRRGVNDKELGAIVEHALSWPNVRGVVFQPVQAAGRLEQYPDGYQVDRDRLPLSEVRRRLLAQSDRFIPEDIIPVPCHADAVAMAYGLRQGNNLIPLTRLVTPELLIQAAGNTISYEQETGLQQSLFNLFSTHHNPHSQGEALSEMLNQAEQPSLASTDYGQVFRVMIVEFIDAHNFDLRSIRKSCVHIVHPDGERVIPFDTYNLLYRDQLEQQVLAPLRDATLPMGGPISLGGGR
ncbi:radical SAM protein [Ferrimonas marina]|uniref:Radical SAM core domain-containing protein n=1 Tax=Ferrimonas marina TaxID=299255 RepID=A0A1M5MFJ0_9GAMM|nr:radical SAM protein [Ferrimonas marina]SHG75942.1 hypothetical protein SAMN02745129_0626 [Ferrimonas marina]